MAETFLQKTVLVTGAAGFIGSHLCDRLVTEGARVIGVDNLLSGRKENLATLLSEHSEQFQFIEADVSQPVSQYPAVVPPLDIIAHLASLASPPWYQKYPVETYQVNAQGTHNLLQHLLKTNPLGRFLFASTSEVYGDPLEHPQTESYWGNVNPNGIRSCYDEGKRLGETICGVHERDFDLDVRIMRIFNTYGPRINPIDGRVIPQFISELLRGQAISMFGDGKQTRSFCFISDLIEGMVALLAHPNAKGQTVNLGNPKEVTMLEVAEKIAEILDKPLQINSLPLPKDDPKRRQPDISKAKSLLHWEPRVSLEDGLKETIAYFQAHEMD